MPINEDIIPEVPEPGELIAIEQDTKIRILIVINVGSIMQI